MKFSIVIDYLTGIDENFIVEQYNLDGNCLIVVTGNITKIYPLFDVKSIVITSVVNA